MKLSSSEIAKVNACVDLFEKRRPEFDHLALVVRVQLEQHPLLRTLIHSVRHRVKDKDHLKLKLTRRALKHKSDPKSPPPVGPNSLFSEITDLAGVRVLHLHTSQTQTIDSSIKSILAGQNFPIIEGPVANTWDDEYRGYYEKLGMSISPRESMYTSVHYVVAPNRQTDLRCEVQVRTLVEEVWGEVSHMIDYPVPTASIACKEQLRVLARLSSGYIRLVDSIFESHKEFTQLKETAPSLGRKRDKSLKNGLKNRDGH